jgi:hypothetical protein
MTASHGNEASSWLVSNPVWQLQVENKASHGQIELGGLWAHLMNALISGSVIDDVPPGTSSHYLNWIVDDH